MNWLFTETPHWLAVPVGVGMLIFVLFFALVMPRLIGRKARSADEKEPKR